MADTFSPEERTAIMKRIKPAGNKSTEIKLIDYFKKNGITGWRRHYDVKGHPDFVFPLKRVAIFVDGCFWHGHDCRNTRPKNNSEYWAKKREKNAAHDRAVTEAFIARGWTVVRIWECELKRKNEPLLEKKLAPVLKNYSENNTFQKRGD